MNIPVIGVILLWVALLAGMLGRYAWPFDLLANFRIHYCVLFVALATALILLRRRRIAAAAVIGAVISAIPAFGYLTVPAQSATAHADSFRLVSLNVWFRNHDYTRIATFLNETHADAIVLQEATLPAARRLKALLPSYPYAHIHDGLHGAVVFSKWPLIAARSRPLATHGSAAAHVQIAWRGSAVTVLGVHLHWPLGSRNAQWRNLELRDIASVAASTAGPLIVAGDFNITPWSAFFQDALARSGLNDCASGQGLAPSWPSRVGWLGIRIDHCLASQHWRTINFRTGPHVGSDHRPLIIELALDASQRAMSDER